MLKKAWEILLGLRNVRVSLKRTGKAKRGTANLWGGLGFLFGVLWQGGGETVGAWVRERLVRSGGLGRSRGVGSGLCGASSGMWRPEEA